MKVKMKYIVLLFIVLVLVLACTQPFETRSQGHSDEENIPQETLPQNEFSGQPRVKAGSFDFATVQSVEISINVMVYRNNPETGALEVVVLGIDDYETGYTILDTRSSVVVTGAVEPERTTVLNVTLPAAEQFIAVNVQRPGFSDTSVTIENPTQYSSVSMTLHIGEIETGRISPTSGTPLNYAYNSPPDGVYTIAYEDLFPAVGDADYNDFIASFHFTFELDARSRVRKIEGWVTARARGAAYDHLFGFVIPMPGLKGTLTVQNFDPANPGTPIPITTNASVQDKANIVIFQNTMQAFRRQTSSVTFDNAYPDEPPSEGFTAYFSITGIEAVGVAPNPWFAGTAPFDPYLVIHNTNGNDVHLIGKPPLDNTTNPEYTLDWDFRYGGDLTHPDFGYPWALLVPVDWQHPLERNRIDNAYPRFIDWVGSQGETDKDWYLYPVEDQVFPNSP